MDFLWAIYHSETVSCLFTVHFPYNTDQYEMKSNGLLQTNA